MAVSGDKREHKLTALDSNTCILVVVTVVGANSSVAAAENVEISSTATHILKPDGGRHVANLVPTSSGQ